MVLFISNIKKSTKGFHRSNGNLLWLFDLVNGESKKQMERGRKNRGGGDESMRV